MAPAIAASRVSPFPLFTDIAHLSSGTVAETTGMPNLSKPVISAILVIPTFSKTFLAFLIVSFTSTVL